MKISEFAERIDVFTTQFEAHINKHGLGDKIVDMGEPYDCRKEGLPLCNTPACHGGEIAIMYDEMGVLVEFGYDTHNFFEAGAYCLATQLGLSNDYALEGLVSGFLEKEWGNDCPEGMFDTYLAFLTQEERDYVVIIDYGDLLADFYDEVEKNTTLTKILNHWKLFSERIKERAKTDDFEIPEGYLL